MPWIDTNTQTPDELLPVRRILFGLCLHKKKAFLFKQNGGCFPLIHFSDHAIMTLRENVLFQQDSVGSNEK
jgi:hypothetical protein